jgi:hypothetical protein
VFLQLEIGETAYQLIVHRYSAFSGTSGVDIAQAERALGSSPAIDWREAEERSQVATSHRL